MLRRIETKTSRTAEFTCMMRCISYLEKRPAYRCDDFVALAIMNSLVKPLLRIPALKRRIAAGAPKGMYEYVVARTKYIDGATRVALENGAQQVLILGAGFDSRAIRFQAIAESARFFEVDAPATQSAKIKRYGEKRIAIPDNLTFIPIDFERQRLPERLIECGFERGRHCLVIMEGLLMYLQPESVDGLFRVVRDFAGPGSRVVFDFIRTSVLERKELYEGERQLVETTAKNGERFRFGLERGDLPEFLSRYGLALSDVADATALEDRYLHGEGGIPGTHVTGTHLIATAIWT